MSAGSDPKITHLLTRAGGGDPRAAEELLPLVYDELRRLARARLANEPAGQTLQPTALVHEAYLRLVGEQDPGWNSRGHFFGAAAPAMRRILVDQARRKGRLRHGGGKRPVDLDNVEIGIEPPTGDLLAIDEAPRWLDGDTRASPTRTCTRSCTCSTWSRWPLAAPWAKARLLSEGRMRGHPPVRFDERDVETEHGTAREAPADERAGNR